MTTGTDLSVGFRFAAIAVVVLGLSQVGACSDGSSEPALKVQSTRGSLQVRVGPEGAVLELEERGRLTIPRGALDETVEISVRVASADEAARPAGGFEGLDAPIEITPHGQELRQPARLELVVRDQRVPDAELRVLRLDDARDETFEGLELEVVGAGERSRAQREQAFLRESEDTVTPERRAEVRLDRFSFLFLAREGLPTSFQDAGQLDAGPAPVLDAGADAAPTEQPDAGTDAGAKVTRSVSDHYRTIAAGGQATVVILDGKLWAFGQNDQGRLGTDSPRSFVPTPLASVAEETFVHVVGGADFFAALTDTGDLYSWGSDTAGQQGNDAGGEEMLPHVILSDVATVDIAERHVLALDNQARLWFWGGNVQVPTETPAPEGAHIVSIAEGLSHHLLLDDTGRVWGWGNNGVAQLGDQGGASRFDVPVLLTMADNTTPFADILAIEASYNTSFLLDARGQIWAFGSNTYGTAGSGSTGTSQAPGVVSGPDSSTRFVKLSATEDSVAAVDATGRGWAFGRNPGTRVIPVTPIDCSGSCNANATVFEGEGNPSFQDVSLGSTHAIALDASGGVWAWGRNDQGQLGDGTALGRNEARGTPEAVLLPDGRKPVAIHMTHSGSSPRTTVIYDSGDIWTWGRSPTVSGASAEGVTPARIAGLAGRKIVSQCGTGTFTAVADDQGKVWTFGASCSQGELGTGDAAVTTTDTWLPVALPADTRVTQVACTNNTGYALSDTGALWAWGDDFGGQLGDGNAALPDVNFSATPVQVVGVDGTGLLTNVVSVDGSVNSPSREHASALLSDGSIVVWGGLTNLGLGRKGPEGCTGSGYACSRVPLRVCDPGILDLLDCDDDAGQVFLNLAEPRELESSSGTLFARSGSSLYSWGDNNQGKLGQGTEDTDDGHPTLMATPVPPLGGDVRQLAAGNDFGLLLDDAGDVWSWGRNTKGQLGKGSNDDGNCSGTGGSDNSCSRVPSKIPGLDAVDVVYIEAGNEHAAALDAQGRVWTWGSNASGELGHNRTTGVGGGHVGALEPHEVVNLPR